MKPSDLQAIDWGDEKFSPLSEHVTFFTAKEFTGKMFGLWTTVWFMLAFPL